MSEMRVTQHTTLDQLTDFAKGMKEGHELRAKEKDGVVTLYSKSPGKFSFNTKEKDRPEKFELARQTIRTVMERNTGGAKVDKILSGIHIEKGMMSGHRVAQPLTGGKLQDSLQAMEDVKKGLEQKERARQDDKLGTVSTPSLLQRNFEVSGSGGTGVIFAKGPQDGTDVVLKFDMHREMQTTERIFEALDTVSDMHGDLPFAYGRHELVNPGPQLDELKQKLGQGINSLQDQVRDLAQKHGVQLKPGREFFDEHGKVDIFAMKPLKDAIAASPEDLETFKKIEGKLSRMIGMKGTLESEGHFSKYIKLGGRPLDSITPDRKGELLRGEQFPREMGKGGMIVSMLGLKDHGGMGNANMGNFLISDSGKLSIVDITTDVVQGQGGGLIRGVPHQNNIDECERMVDLIKDGKLETLQRIVDGVLEDKQPDVDHGGVGRFAQSTLGEGFDDRLFTSSQGQDRAQVVGGMDQKDQVRLLANYLLGAYEGMKFIVDNKDQMKAMIRDSQLGVGPNGTTPDPDMLLDNIEQQFLRISDKHIEKLTKLTQ